MLIAKENFDPNKQDDFRKTPLHWILWHAYNEKSPEIKKEFIEIAKLLIAKENFDPNKQDDNNDTPLDIAQRNELTEIITLLQNKGAKQ